MILDFSGTNKLKSHLNVGFDKHFRKYNGWAKKFYYYLD